MVIINYLITVIFFILLGLIYFLLGTAIVKDNQKLETTKVIVGLMVHTFLLSIVGIVFQVLKLQWKLYFVFTIIWTLCCVVYSVYIIRKRNLRLFYNGVDGFVKKYWFFIILLGIFSLTVLCNAGRMWSDNLTDDGYYLVRIANLPYMKHTFSCDVTTGFSISGINSYTLNTWELEASVYLFITHVLPTVFVRFGMSIFNFFLILCGLHSLIGRMVHYYDINKDENNYQYYCFLLIPILFAMTMLSKSLLSLDLEDTWKNTTAMFYGSSLVRLLLPLVFMDLFYSIKQIGLKEIMISVVLSVVFVSRSTVAIPLIFLMVITYIFMLLIKNKKYVIALVTFALLLFISILLNNVKNVADYSISRISNNFTSVFTIIMFIAFIILILLKKEKRYIFVFIALFVTYAFAYFEPINNIYEKICNYGFVTGRVLYSVYFMMYILVTLLISLNIFKRKTLYIKILTVVFMVICSASVILTQNIYGDVVEINGTQTGGTGIKKSVTTINNNKALTPDSTINVGKKLHELELKTDKRLKVITTFDWQSIDGYAHYPALTYRSYAYNIYNYTALFRVGNDSDQYTWNEHVSICSFANNPNEETYNAVKNVLNRMQFDCIVSNNKNIQDYLANDYYLYDTVVDNNQINAYFLFAHK